MAIRARRKRGGFLDSYKLDEAYLVKADRKSGRPGILTGTDENGNAVLVKVWPKAPGSSDGDLREIWHVKRLGFVSERQASPAI